MLAKILVALGVVIALVALVIALADQRPAIPSVPNKPPGLCKDKPHHKLNPHQEDRCDR